VDWLAPRQIDGLDQRFAAPEAAQAQQQKALCDRIKRQADRSDQRFVH
jgi:hypothetical protein